MFTKAISEETRATLALLGESNLLKDAYLAGGTALALHLGHRLSFDLDFFTAKEFDPLETARKLQRVLDLKIETTSRGTILGIIKDVRFSLFLYQYKLLSPCKKFLGMNISDTRDIAAMKMVAISERGVKRDFVDLYFICQKIGLEEVLELYNKKYGKLTSNLFHVMKSLVYFTDTEDEEMPNMLKPCGWEKVKKFFEQEVKRLTDKFIK
ncbi:MAG: nucleotidyl transferase AbiEii/AbiGii toxin family protein [Candidatus Omnitrophica bacterium]|nr:nucleotidyl transferase AbiEii/AbiGii toxin family protein [Candidatus Omnitrophota bacterium]